MLELTFNEFYKKYEEFYDGEKECKEKLIEAIKKIPVKKRKGSQPRTLIALLEEVKPFVFEEPIEDLTENEWEERNGNLISSFGKKKGSRIKAAALHYLFLINPDYKDAKGIMNEAVFQGKVPNELSPKEANENSLHNTLQVISADKQPHWQLATVSSKSIDTFECKVAFETRQPRKVGEEVDLFSKAVIPRSFEIENYEISFKEVRISTNEIPNTICEFSHPREWEASYPSQGSTTFELDDVGVNRSIKIATTNGVLEGSYIFDECYFLALKPNTKPFKFSAELLTRGRDQNISKTDGTKLPSEEKKAIIHALILKEIGSHRDGDWVTIAKTDYKLIGDQED